MIGTTIETYQDQAEILAAEYAVDLIPADVFNERDDLNHDPDWPERWGSYQLSGDYAYVAQSNKQERFVIAPSTGKRWSQGDYFAVLHELGHVVAGSDLTPMQALRAHEVIQEEAVAWRWALDHAGEQPSRQTATEIVERSFASYLNTGEHEENMIPYEEGICPLAIQVMNELLAIVGNKLETMGFNSYARQLNAAGEQR